MSSIAVAMDTSEFIDLYEKEGHFIHLNVPAVEAILDWIVQTSDGIVAEWRSVMERSRELTLSELFTQQRAWTDFSGIKETVLDILDDQVTQLESGKFVLSGWHGLDDANQHDTNELIGEFEKDLASNTRFLNEAYEIILQQMADCDVVSTSNGNCVVISR